MIQSTTRLRIPNLLAAGPKSVQELARATETHERTLYRIIRALASQGIFQLTDDDMVRQTPISAALVMQPNSIAPMVTMFDRASLHPGAKILVAERVISDEGSFSSFHKKLYTALFGNLSAAAPAALVCA